MMLEVGRVWRGALGIPATANDVVLSLATSYLSSQRERPRLIRLDIQPLVLLS